MDINLRALMYYIVTVIFISLVIGCAGSKQTTDEPRDVSQEDDYTEIERLLGITPEDKQQTSQESEDDDLLQLLQTSESSEGDVSTADTEQTDNQDVSQLEKEVEDLKQQLKEKNKTIADLKVQMIALEDEAKNQSPRTSTRREMGSVSYQSSMSDSEYRDQYNYGYQLVQNQNYNEAIEVFESLLAADSKHSLADNAQYWIGECYYFLGDYKSAILAFEKVFTYKNSNKNDYAQYKLGLCYFELNDRQRAREEFQSFLDNYESSPLIGKAQQYMSRL